MSDKMPSDWAVPDGWVLTWYPPFVFPYKVAEDQLVLVYNDAEPFVASGGGFRPNVTESTLDQFDGVHPGTYALNIHGEEPGVWVSPDAPEGEEPAPVHPDARQRYGKEVAA